MPEVREMYGQIVALMLLPYLRSTIMEHGSRNEDPLFLISLVAFSDFQSGRPQAALTLRKLKVLW